MGQSAGRAEREPSCALALVGKYLLLCALGLIPPLPATQLDSKAIIFRHSEEVYGIIPTVPAGEIRRASTLQSNRLLEREKFRKAILSRESV